MKLTIMGKCCRIANTGVALRILNGMNRYISHSIESNRSIYRFSIVEQLLFIVAPKLMRSRLSPFLLSYHKAMFTTSNPNMWTASLSYFGRLSSALTKAFNTIEFSIYHDAHSHAPRSSSFHCRDRRSASSGEIPSL